MPSTYDRKKPETAAKIVPAAEVGLTLEAEGGDVEPPTAIFGGREIEVWLAQSLVLRRRRELLARLDVVGYGNTPWSEAGHPPFTTVAFDLERIVAEVMGVMDRVRGDSPRTETLIHVPPRLVVREAGQKEFDNAK